MRKIVTALVLSMGIVGAQSASAYYLTGSERCSTIDLRKEFSWNMHNQGDISWCYAHAASDYLQYYFKVPNQISAADIAIQYNLRPWPRLMRWLNKGSVPETGFIRSALWDALESGYCPESVFPSDHWTKVDGKGSSAVQLKTAIEDMLQLQENVQNRFFRSAAELPYYYSFKNVSKETFFDLLANTRAKDFLNQLRLSACEKDRVAYAGDIDAIGMRIKGKNTFNRINQLLETKTPVAVDFFYGFLNNADQYPHVIGDLHTTLLVGRRFQASSGECQYLIKNSYGPDCAEYDSRHTCEGGYIWVNESYLYSAMTSYVYIKDRLFDDSGPDLARPQTPSEPGAQSSAVVPASTESL